VAWIVEIGDEFEPEFNDLHEDVRIEILALTRLSGMSNWSRPAPTSVASACSSSPSVWR
jgi:hypothetical protein